MSKPLSFADIPGGPSVGETLTTLQQLNNEGAVELIYREDGKLFLGFIIIHDGAVFAYRNSCPHAGTPLNLYGPNFYNAQKTRLLCATHGAQFEVATGDCVKGPCKGEALTPLAIMISDDSVIAA